MLQFLSISPVIEIVSGGDSHLASLVNTWIIIWAAVVALCFIVSEITRNYSQVDKLWSLMPAIYGWVTVAYYPFSYRMWLMALLATLWGFRLSYNFYRKGGYNIIPWRGEEDYRWQIMRDNPLLKGRVRFGLFNLLFISFYQQLLILLFSSPLLMAASSPNSPLNLIDALAAVTVLSFLAIETIADNQQYRFQQQKRRLMEADPSFAASLKRGFISEGLWGYVRHPNFVSEQAIWISFYFFGVAATGVWLNYTIAGAVLLVLLFIGSTHLTEKISSGKYPEYKTYQKEVPRFIPSFRSLIPSKEHQKIEP